MIAREFWRQQAPLIGAALVLGVIAAYWQHGFVPGAEQAFPVAGVRVPVWHLVWMGIWTGYTMAVVGEAAGIFALPYSMSILQFVNASVTPSTQLLTFLNPFGALLGFRRSGQWNLKFAGAVCLGGAVGGLIGPFLRSRLLAAADVFHFSVGIALAIAGIHLCYAAFHSASRRKPQIDPYRNKVSIGAQVHGLRIRVSFGEESWDLSMLALFGVGAGVGMFASALGVGGGFLLVPAMIYLMRIPTRIVIGTSTVQILCVTAFTTVLQATMNHTVDLLLSVPLMAGSVVGAQFGVGFSERFKAEQLRALLSLIVIAVAIRMAFGLVIRPSDLYSLDVPH